MTEPKILLTGSRAYGNPRISSDVDVVVRCPRPLAQELWGYMDSAINPTDKLPSEAFPGYSIRQGMLNLILATDDTQFEAWRRGTNELKELMISRRENIPREECVEHFRKLWKEYGFNEKS